MNHSRHTQRGMTLVELMIAGTLGLLLILGITTLFSQVNQSGNQNEQIAGMQESARYAMNVLAEDLSTAGFIGGMLRPADANEDDTAASLSGTACGPSGDTDWTYDLTNLVQFVPQETAANINAAFDCITTSEATATTSALAIKRARGPGTPYTSTPDDEEVYIRVSGSEGCLWYAASGVSTPTNTGSVCPTSLYEDWEYLTHIYYIRNHAVSTGDGIPTLCRKHIVRTGTPSMETQCLAEGIEQFHIEFGIDSNADNVANYYKSTPTTIELGKVVSARLYVLGRSVNPDYRYKNEKSYKLGDLTVNGNNDPYYRRLYTTTIVIRNMANLANF